MNIVFKTITIFIVNLSWSYTLLVECKLLFILFFICLLLIVFLIDLLKIFYIRFIDSSFFLIDFILFLTLHSFCDFSCILADIPWKCLYPSRLVIQNAIQQQQQGTPINKMRAFKSITHRSRRRCYHQNSDF